VAGHIDNFCMFCLLRGKGKTPDVYILRIAFDAS
jgi:hypothetical protein